MLSPMIDMFKLIWWAAIGLFRSGVSLEVKILALLYSAD